MDSNITTDEQLFQYAPLRSVPLAHDELPKTDDYIHPDMDGKHAREGYCMREWEH